MQDYALILHSSKVMLQILNNQIETYPHREIPPEQDWFMPGRCTREQMMNAWQIIKKCRDFNIPEVMCFTDYTKAIDCVNWKKVFKVLRKIEVPAYIVDLAKSLHE